MLSPMDKKTLDENLAANLAALKCAPDQQEIAEWIEAASSSTETSVVMASDYNPVLTIGGSIQDSLAYPGQEAEKLMLASLPDPPTPSEIWLFGLGGPALVSAMLNKRKRFTAFEPDPAVARATLSAIDVSAAIFNHSFRLAFPQTLAKTTLKPVTAVEIVHPSSRRRALNHYAGFKRFLFGNRTLPLEVNEKPSVMIIGPLSGGSEPMAGFLAKAAGALSLRRFTLVWPESLKAAAENLRIAPSSKAARELMSAAASFAASEVQHFHPSLILFLAQAPLDAVGLMAIREARPEAISAFWFVEDYRRFGYLADIAPAFDIVLHIQGRLLDSTLRNLGVSRAAYLPAAADETVFAPGPPDPHYAAQISMMGAGYPNRRKIMANLAKALKSAEGPRKKLTIFGSGWDNAPSILTPRLFEGGRRVTTKECAAIYRSSDVNLNIHSGTGEGLDPEGAFVNPRTFEVAAAGGFQIIDSRELLPPLFGDGELTVISDPEELPDAVANALKNPDLRRAQAEAARKTVLSKHLYRHRLSAVLRAVGAPAWPNDLSEP